MTTTVTALIEAALARHGKAVAMYSGGKESVVLAHLLEPFKDSVTLAWVNTGAMFPHMQAFIRAHVSGFQYVELASNQPERLSRVGWPSRIVPIFNTPLGTTAEREPEQRLMITDWISCCGDLRGRPILEYCERERVRLVFHGQRDRDNCRPFYSMPGHIEQCGPLWDWSETEIFDYITAHDLELPEQYRDGADSLECWNCTADPKPARIRYMRDKHPEMLKQLKPLLGAVYGAVADEYQKMQPIFAEAAKPLEEQR